MTNNPDNENLVLIDKDGNEVEFGFIGSLESEGNEYVVLSPIDLTGDIAEENGFTVDIDGFNKEMEMQRKRAREAAKRKSCLGSCNGSN